MHLSRRGLSAHALGTLSLSLALTCAAGAATPTLERKPSFQVNPPRVSDATREAAPSPTGRYIVAFTAPPLASYTGNLSTLPSPDRLTSGPRAGRLDPNSPSAQAYVDHLRRQQATFESQLAGTLGRSVTAIERFQHAINGVVLKLSPNEVALVRGQPGVKFVVADRVVEQDTDLGPALIGAPAVWASNGAPLGDVILSSSFEDGETPPPAATQNFGEGMVVGIIDSGINFPSPSYAATDALGYTHQNPFGDGNFQGQCAAGGIDEGKCNDKLVGAYDFVFDDVCIEEVPGNPATNPCRVGGPIAEEPSATDNNGHGSHTASTAAGNFRTGTYRGNELTLSGVAPRANIIAYDVCYTEISTGRGLCPQSSSVSAINQAVANGVVDVINFSIGGGQEPWDDAVSLAFLGAVDAGIYVATSAGNAGPGAGTLGHVEPWTSATAATTHSRGGIEYQLTVTGPGEPPATLVDLTLVLGAAGGDFTTALPATTPLVVSPDYLASATVANDGCAAYPAGTFAGAIAVIRRGSCAFSLKAENAQAAGAVAVIIANNDAAAPNTAINPGATPPVPTVPVFGVSFNRGNDLRAFDLANDGVTATIPYPAVISETTPDVMADFSSRGPSGYDLVKPDVAAPGVDILAAYSGDGETIEIISGTSMASPHNAGAAALIRKAHPFWSPMQVKSALMLTAKSTGVVKEDGTTPTDPWDRGAGRIQVDRAVNVGFVLSEGGFTMANADPANGGDPSTLNIASLAKYRCVNTCTFTRKLKSTQSVAKSYTAALTGLTGGVTPSTFSIPANGERTITITVDTTAFASDGVWRFGEVSITPTDTALPTTHMPVAVSMPPPEATLTPVENDITVPANDTDELTLTLRNIGGPTLTYDMDSAATVYFDFATQPDEGVGSGNRSTTYTVPQAPPAGRGQYAADDITVTEPTTLSRFVGYGFTSTGSLTANATSIGISIFPDAGGVPAGDPLTNPGAAVYSYSGAVGSPGLSGADDNISIDLIAAGQTPPTLAPGKYWVVFHAVAPFANRWVWFVVDTQYGDFMLGRWPDDTPPDDEWFAAAFSAAMDIDSSVTCGAPWITGVTPAAGALAGGASAEITVEIDTTGLAPGEYVGYVCADTNGVNGGDKPARINLTVTPGTP